MVFDADLIFLKDPFTVFENEFDFKNSELFFVISHYS